MKCPSCQYENAESAKFCDECGQKTSPTASEKTSAFLSHEDQLSRIRKHLPRGLAENILAQRNKIEGEALEKLIFKNMREIIIKGSELRPTVIFIEDFHRVDTSSLELIEALFRLVEEYRILFILVLRSGYADTGERIIKSIEENYPTHWTKIALEPLNEAENETLLSNLLQIKGLPHNIRDQILQRAGGNPFFIEEVVRSLFDEGAVVLKNASRVRNVTP